MSKLTELRKKYDESVAALQQLRDAYHAQGTKWVDSQEATFNEVSKSIDETRSAIEAEQRANSIDEVLNASREFAQRAANNPGNLGRGQIDTPKPEKQEARDANLWKRNASNFTEVGLLGLTRSDWNEANRLFRSRKAGSVLSELEKRALSAIETAKGGVLIPSVTAANIEMNMLAYGSMLQAATTMVTEAGGTLVMPTVDDTGNSATALTENSAASEVNPSFQALRLGDHKYSSGYVLIPRELLEDTGGVIASMIPSQLGERLARKENVDFTTGDGAGKPTGLLTATTLGKTAASATTFTYDELIDLFHSVDPAYRQMPGAGWMMSDAALAIVRKLKDGAGQYLWQAGNSAEEVDRIQGKPVFINQSFPSVATGNKTVAFGDLSKYIIRRVRGVYVTRLNELFAQYDQIAFLAFSRVDGGLLNAGTAPVKHLAQA